MKSLGAAIASALLAVAGVFFGLREWAEFDRPAAAQLAASVMAAIPYIRELLDKTFLAQQGPRTPAVISIGDFGLSSRRMVLYGTLIVAGAMNLASGLGAVSANFIGVTTDLQWLRVVGIVAILIQFPAICGVGCWVGRRCASHGLAVIFLISFFARLATALLDDVLITPAVISEILPSFPSLIVRIVAGTAVLSLVGLLGYCRGRRQRVAAYFSYLLQRVSEDTRKAIVDLAFEEARATRTRGGSASGRGEQEGCSA